MLEKGVLGAERAVGKFADTMTSVTRKRAKVGAVNEDRARGLPMYNMDMRGVTDGVQNGLDRAIKGKNLEKVPMSKAPSGGREASAEDAIQRSGYTTVDGRSVSGTAAQQAAWKARRKTA